MYRLLFSIFLTVLVYSQVTFRLNTKQTTKLNVDNSISSTLGLFKATLRKNNCSLQISSFNDSTYLSKGFYNSPNVTKDCSYLQVVQGALMTSQNQQFMYVGDSFNESTIFTIDDLGVIRLIGSYIKLNRVDQQSFETNITQFYTQHKFIYAGTQLNVRFQNSYGPLKNDRGWVFSAQYGQLDLFFNQNPDKLQSYVYSRFKINNSQIQDFNSDTFPSAIFSNITFQPRCFQPRIYINFKAPYLIIADQYFPKLTVMEQGGYKIFEFIYAKRSQFTYQQQKKDIHYWRQFSLCPDQTFQHKGQCLTSCPAPYFHEMKGRAGTCRLVCQEFTPVDLVNRICTCMSNYQAPKYTSQLIRSCPNDTIKYPYGCYCKNAGKYFDKKLTYSCVDNCPQKTFAHQGLCVNCPNNCLTCGIDMFYRMFLECKVCQTGYKLNDGQCFKQCNTNLGYSLASNGTCVKCADTNCVNCSKDPNVCLKCSLLFALSNGTCLQSCPSNYTLVPASFFDNQCLPSDNTVCNTFLTNQYKTTPFLKCDECKDTNLIPHLQGCVSSCPSGYKRYQNITGWFYCSCVSGRTIHNQCLNVSACPIKMYYDIYSDSCLSCPFGCISCRGSICTSCYPGYFLYVSPQIILCRRKSPLFACNDQYALWNDICLVTDFANLQMTQCRKNIPNCRVCPFKADFRQTVCVICQLGYYLHQNKCVKACPSGTIVYSNSTCVLAQIQNCAIPHLESTRQSSILNISFIEKNKAYGYYIFSNTQYANDPVGYIPYFQKITSSRRITDGLYRQNSFFQPEWTCLKCENGYGLAEKGSKCIKCPEPCITCYLAQSNSCLTKKQLPIDNNGTNNSTNNTNGCQGYVQFSTGQCLKSCNSTNSYPQFSNNILYCKKSTQSKVSDFVRIDSAIYMQGDGTKVAYFVFQNQIPLNTNVTVRIKKNALSTSRLLLQNPRILAQQYTEKVVQIQNNRYFQVTTATDENVIIANFTSSIAKLGSVQGYYPPNLIYGSTAQNTHPQFMKTWLAIIGYIMSCVIVAMHCVYIGNQLLYKMDNLIILTQTIYYFSFVKILVGRLLAQFYYGWIFSHLGFFPNFFTTPNQYRQNEAPISYKLATTDANFIRNAGFSISIFLVFIGSWILVTGVVYVLSKKLHKKQIWYPNIAKSSLIGGIQIFSMNIMYWAIAHFMYRDDCQNCDENYHRGSLAWAIIFTILICIYTIVRFIFNPIGGLYMFKRVIIAIILPAAFDDLRLMSPLIILQLVFVGLRFLIQGPQSPKQKISILVQFGGILLCYLLLFLCTNSGVNTIIISIVIFFYIVILMSDFMELYLESKNQWQLEEQKGASQLQKVPTNHIQHSNVRQVKKSDINKNGSQQQYP